MSIALEIINVSKEYRLGVIGHGTLYRDLQSWWAKIRKKSDPNKKIDGTVDGRIDALKDINLKLHDGEVLGVIGPNGAGKSTLLKILSRVTLPSRGEIRIKGKISSLLEVGTGFHPELTGRENIFLNGTINGMTKNEIMSKLDEIVEFANIKKFLDTPVKRYSSGMYVRLAFSVAAHLEPDILVVDEVLAVGDAQFQKKAISKMKSVSSKKNKTVIFVSHNMESIRNLCSKAVLIDRGKLVEYGETNHVINKYLNLNIDKADTNIQWNLENAPGNDYLKLLYAKISQENNEQGNFDISKDIQITFKYQIFSDGQKILPRIWVNDVYDRAVFESNNTFPMSKKNDYYFNKTLEKGIYTTVCTIPAFTLNFEDYLISIIISKFPFERGGGYIVFEKNLLKINCYDSSDITEFGYYDKLRGSTRPQLLWSTDKQK